MRVESAAESISVEEGPPRICRLAFDLAGSEVGYLLISTPVDAAAATEFFGYDHYVEVKDQLFGRYGGLATLRVNGDRELEIGLSYEVTDIGRKLTVITRGPMTTALLSRLGQLERS